jgi:hypothetical protein
MNCGQVKPSIPLALCTIPLQKLLNKPGNGNALFPDVLIQHYPSSKPIYRKLNLQLLNAFFKHGLLS